MTLSIVTTLYKSSPYINEFYERISAEAQKITTDYEIIFVDDGSPDDSLYKAIELHRQNTKVIVIELSRNFGHHNAIMTGLAHTKGEYVFLIDSDLEEEPELLTQFWNEFKNNDTIDAVYGVQQTRKGGIFERWSGALFYKVLNFLTDATIPKNFLTVRLMTHNYVKNLVKFQERELNFSTIIFLNGFKTKELIVTKLAHSPTSYSFTKKVAIFVNAITSSSTKIIWMFFYFGLIVTSIAILIAIQILINKFVYETTVSGWTSIMIAILFFGGIIILQLGILGIYISKNYIETKKRPYTIIRNIFQ